MNETRPLFSIVMPAYNAEPYLAQAVGSIERQTMPDWELVIVDDASLDGTAKVAERLAAQDARIRVVRHEANRGAAEARNTGIAAARGLYLWMADADDEFESNLLMRCAEALAENPAAITVFGLAEVYYDEAGNVTRVHEATFPEARCATAEQLRPLVLPLERSTLYGYSANKVYDLDFLRSTGVRYEHFPLVEDFFFNVRVFQDAPSMNVLSGAPYRYARRPNESLTRAFVSEYYPLHRRRIQEMRDQIASWGLLDAQACSVLGGLFARYIISAAERASDPRSGLSEADRKAWLADVFQDPLFNELLPVAVADDKLLRACMVPLKHKNASALLVLGKAIHAVRSRSEFIYSIAKQGR